MREFLGDPSHTKMMPRLVHLIAEYSSDEEFLQVSIEGLNGFADNKADEKTLRALLMPGEDKAGLLDVHFRDQSVQSALKKCLKHGIGDPSYASMINRTLSGDGAKDVLEWAGAGFPKRYERLALQAILAHAIGTHWIWIAGCVILVLAVWLDYRRRSER